MRGPGPRLHSLSLLVVLAVAERAVTDVNPTARHGRGHPATEAVSGREVVYTHEPAGHVPSGRRSDGGHASPPGMDTWCRAILLVASARRISTARSTPRSPPAMIPYR